MTVLNSVSDSMGRGMIGAPTCTAWPHNMRFRIFWVTTIGWETDPIYRPFGKIGQDLNHISESGLLLGDWHGWWEKTHKTKPNHTDWRKGEATNRKKRSWEDKRNRNGKGLGGVKEKGPRSLPSVTCVVESLPRCAIVPGEASAFSKVPTS